MIMWRPILEELRDKLLELVKNKGIKDDEVLKVSQQLDKLIYEFYIKEKVL